MSSKIIMFTKLLVIILFVDKSVLLELSPKLTCVFYEDLLRQLSSNENQLVIKALRDEMENCTNSSLKDSYTKDELAQLCYSYNAYYHDLPEWEQNARMWIVEKAEELHCHNLTDIQNVPLKGKEHNNLCAYYYQMFNNIPDSEKVAKTALFDLLESYNCESHAEDLQMEMAQMLAVTLTDDQLRKICRNQYLLRDALPDYERNAIAALEKSILDYNCTSDMAK